MSHPNENARTMNSAGPQNVPPGLQQQQQRHHLMQNQPVQPQPAHSGHPVMYHQQNYPPVSTSSGHHAAQSAYYHQGIHGMPQGFYQISPFPIVVANPGMPLHALSQAQTYIPRYTFQPGVNQQPTTAAAYHPSVNVGVPVQYQQQMSTAAANFFQQQRNMHLLGMSPSSGQGVGPFFQNLHQAPVCPIHGGPPHRSQQPEFAAPPQLTGPSTTAHPYHSNGMNPSMSSPANVTSGQLSSSGIPCNQRAASSPSMVSSISSCYSESESASPSTSASPFSTNQYESRVPEEFNTSFDIQSSLEDFVEEAAEGIETSGDGIVTLEDGEIRETEITESARQINIKDELDSVPERDICDMDPAGSVRAARIRYDREFLLQIGLQTERIKEFKPAESGFPTIAKDYPMEKQSRSRCKQREKKKAVKLNVAKNPWRRSDKFEDSPVDVKTVLARKTLGILNRLTAGNFVKMASKFMKLLPPKDGNEHISTCFRVVFQKAIDDPYYSAQYARLVYIVCVCKTSEQKMSQVFEIRNQIRDQCQNKLMCSSTEETGLKEVEQKLGEATEEEETRKQLEMTLEEKKYINRRRSQGNVRFIEELFRLQVLSPETIIDFVQKLLYSCDEEKLESVCNLLTNIGQALDLQLKMSNESKWMNQIFCQLWQLHEDTKFSTKIRFSTLGVIELRENCWKSKNEYESMRAEDVPGEMKSNPIIKDDNNDNVKRFHHHGRDEAFLPDHILMQVQAVATKKQEDMPSLTMAETHRVPAELKLIKGEKTGTPVSIEQSYNNKEANTVDSIASITRLILSKLKSGNWRKIILKIMELLLEDKEERLSAVISTIFENAIQKPSTSQYCAKILHTVCKKSEGKNSLKINKLILCQLQKEFQKIIADEVKIHEMEEKLAEPNTEKRKNQFRKALKNKKKSNKMKSRNQLKLFGELYKVNLLTPKIMMECIQQLLIMPDDEKLECLCKILTAVGQKLDLHLKGLEDAAQQGEKLKFVPKPNWMDRIFSQLKDLSIDERFTIRKRVAIVNVVERRENGWKRKSKAKTGPKGRRFRKEKRSIPMLSEWEQQMTTTEYTRPRTNVKEMKLLSTIKLNCGSEESSSSITSSTITLACGSEESSSITGSTITLACGSEEPSTRISIASWSGYLNECVRDIFVDYLASSRFDDAENRITVYFPGQKIDDFLETLTKHVIGMPDEAACENAGRLIRLLIANRAVSKNTVINVISCVVGKLAVIMNEIPSATMNLAQYLVEIFSDENNLDWLVQVGAKLIKSEDEDNDKKKSASWRDLATKSMALINLKIGEELAVTAFKKTADMSAIPVNAITWLDEK